MTLTLETYVPENAIFPIASTLILGDREAILVDAQFQASRAREVVERIKASGRRLTTIFVSHSDPDYYFGLDTIHAAFPEARILSTPQTAWLIGATKDAKMGVWKDQLGADAPQTLIVPEATDGPLEIEGEKIEIRQSKDDPAHSFLWVPSLKAVIGGVSIFAGAHPWMADTPDLAALDKWIAQLDAMQALDPAVVVAGHGGDGSNAPEVIAA